MANTDSIVLIRTLGSFNISVGKKTVAAEWPDEATKVLFCSLLSPLDMNFTWDRICRSIWGAPESLDLKHILEETSLRTLNEFLMGELGFNPLIMESDGITMNHKRIYLDALEFYETVLEGVRLFSVSNHVAAVEKFTRANILYTGSYLPGMTGKIIESTRHDLESLYQTVVRETGRSHEIMTSAYWMAAEVKSSTKKENHMKSGTRDQVEGKLHELKGTAKEIAGKLSDNPKLEGEGKGEKLVGKVQGKMGQIKKVLER